MVTQSIFTSSPMHRPTKDLEMHQKCTQPWSGSVYVVDLCIREYFRRSASLCLRIFFPAIRCRHRDLRGNVTKTFTFSFLISWRTTRRIKLSVTKLSVIQQTKIYRSNSSDALGRMGNPREENVCTEVVVFLGTANRGAYVATGFLGRNSFESTNY